jgi:PEP-CTERM motif
MRASITGILTAAMLSLASSAKADPITIDFESLAEATSVGASYSGVNLLNATILTAGSSLNEFELPPHSGSNVVFDDGGPMTIAFDDPVFSFGAYFTYLAPLTITLFDANNNVIGTLASLFASNLGLSGAPGSSPNELLAFASTIGIASIVINSGLPSGSFVMDDLTFDTSPAPVPEPGTLSLMALGAGAVWLRRRRARRAA